MGLSFIESCVDVALLFLGFASATFSICLIVLWVLWLLVNRY